MPSFQYNDSDARKPFEEPGDYLCTVEDFEFKFAAGSGNEMLVLKLRTSGGALVFDNLVFIEKAQWKIDHALKCFLPSKGHKLPGKGDNFDIDTDWVNGHLLGATGWVTLSKGTSTSGKMRNNVDAYLDPKKYPDRRMADAIDKGLRKGGQPAPETTTKPAQAAPTSAPAKPAPKAAEPDDPF